MTTPRRSAGGLRVLLTGSGALTDGLGHGLAARGADVRTGWREPATRPALTALLDAVSADLGGLDLVVHTWTDPAALERHHVDELTEAQWIDACERTLDGAYRLAQASHQHLAASRGRLVYLVPTLAMGGAAGYAPFAAAAEGIRALAKGVAKTWGKDGITVNTIAVAAPQLLGAAGDDVSRAFSLSPPALGGIGDPASDLAPVLSMLAGDDAHFLTGSTLVLDGGVWMSL
jgi:NAD(P)-dependent dehydrogenase (short-subunit alcohol dehydrogenase family)